MAKILVSLISDQTIPNVLLIRDLADMERHIFITTHKMEQQKKSDWIMDAAEIPSDKCLKVEVVEDSLADIEDKLKEIDFDDDDEFFVNLTGGTKIMSIGVYNFFRQRRSEIYYIPIGKNVYRKIFPEVKNREMLIHHRVGIAEYLKSYGITVVKKKNLNSLVKPIDYTKYFFNEFLNASPDDLSLVNRLRKERSKKRILTAGIENLDTYLHKIQFPNKEKGELDKDEIKYLTGEWFEEYVYSLLKKTLKLNEQAIAMDINIQRQNVDNEFDVMFTADNSLHVIECKSFIYDEDTGKNILNESLYKLAALERDFGLRVKSYIFTLSERGNEKENIKPSFTDRSNLLRITIADRKKILEDPENLLSK